MNAPLKYDRITELLEEHERIEDEITELMFEKIARAFHEAYPEAEAIEFMFWQEEPNWWNTYSVEVLPEHSAAAEDLLTDLLWDLPWFSKYRLAQQGHSPDKEDWLSGVEGGVPFRLDLTEWADQ